MHTTFIASKFRGDIKIMSTHDVPPSLGKLQLNLTFIPFITFIENLQLLAYVTYFYPTTPLVIEYGRRRAVALILVTIGSYKRLLTF